MTISNNSDNYKLLYMRIYKQNTVMHVYKPACMHTCRLATALVPCFYLHTVTILAVEGCSKSNLIIYSNFEDSTLQMMTTFATGIKFFFFPFSSKASLPKFQPTISTAGVSTCSLSDSPNGISFSSTVSMSADRRGPPEVVVSCAAALTSAGQSLSSFVLPSSTSHCDNGPSLRHLTRLPLVHDWLTVPHGVWNVISMRSLGGSLGALASSLSSAMYSTVADDASAWQLLLWQQQQPWHSVWR